MTGETATSGEAGKERAQLRAALEAAERSIKAGQGIHYDPNVFKKRLTDIYRGSKR